MDISLMGKGAIPLPLQLKDYRLELATSIQELPEVFSLRDRIKEIKSQGSSGSCVAQSFAYYAEVLNSIETGGFQGLSARDIYSLIFQEPMGAWLKDGASKICKSGVVPELNAISYENGNPPTEAYMRKRNDIKETDGYSFIAQKYLTWDNYSVEKFKQAIYQGYGCVSAFGGNNYCWKNTEILVPYSNEQIDWWHAVYLIGFDDSKKCFEFVNSWGKEWGDNGFGKLPYEYIEKGFACNPMTLVDLPNDTIVKYLSMIVNLYKKIIEIYKNNIK